MSEVTFAKSFLATLDKRAIKLPADHVSDPRKYPSESPYILPKQTHAFPRRGPATGHTAKAGTVTVSLKPMRGGETMVMSDIGLDATIHDIKTQYAVKSGLVQDKIKILLNKKPAADLKTLKDLGIEDDVEFSVMLLGGVAAAAASTTKLSPLTETANVQSADAAPGLVADKMDLDPQAPAPESEKAQAEAEQQRSVTAATDILDTMEFWSDLQGFLSQRLRDEGEAVRLAGLFRQAAGKP